MISLVMGTVLLVSSLGNFGGVVHAQENSTDTVTPESSPTNVPTLVPITTNVPTQVPTATDEPTLVPTATEVPTLVPTATDEPTLGPTATEVPTPVPTVTEVPTVAPTVTEVPTVAPKVAPASGFSWELSLDYPKLSDSAGIKAAAISTALSSLAVESKIEVLANGNNRLTLDGAGNIELLRDVIYKTLLPDFSFLNGSGIISIQTVTTAGSPITVNLESQPGTGYTWTLNNPGSSIFSLNEAPTFKDRFEGPGTTALQTLVLKPSASGESKLELIYQRPFEKDQTITRRLTITLPDPISSIDLSDPNPPILATDNSVVNELTSPPDLTHAQMAAASLPSSFDWRTTDKVSNIRDQGACGSCWAFGTTAIMESALRINQNIAVDLSEQFLLSCNIASKNTQCGKNKYDCEYGGCEDAQQYEVNVFGQSQNALGTVLESKLPYVGYDETCPANLPHAYQAASWHFVGGNNPTVDQIKQAIYTYGPVTSRVCVGDNFDNYTGGVLTADDGSCVNHVIALVGWDDSTQSWILRNSWGTSFGENGYMRIHWGISNVGALASYVTMPSIPRTAPTLVGPGGTIYSLKPSYQWNKVSGATGYVLSVTNTDSSTIVINNLSVSSSACGSTVCTSTPAVNLVNDGNYQFEVAAKNAVGQGDFSTPMPFTDLFHTVPDSPTQIAPNSTIYIPKPTYQWHPSGGATGYVLTVTNTDTNAVVVNNVAVPTSACKGSVCSYAPSVTTKTMLDGNYEFDIAAKNLTGQSAFSPMTFVYQYQTAPFAPTSIAPSGTVYISKPSYQWNPSGGSAATGYLLKVTDTDTNAVIVNNVAVPTSACKGSVCSYAPSVTTKSMPDGNYKFEVAGKNSFGQSDYSTPMTFIYQYQTAPFIPTSIAPSGTVYVSKPTYQWNPSGGSAATGYLLKVTNTDTNAVVVNNIAVPTSACKGSVCSYAPSVTTKTMPDGNYKFEVAGKNSFGQSDTSTPMTFGYLYQTAPYAPTAIAPSGTVYVLKPTYQWNPSGGSAATGYLLKVTNTDTNAVVVNNVAVSTSACKGSVCSYTPSVTTLTMPDGNYKFEVAGKNSFGVGSYNTPMNFVDSYQTTPLAPTLLNPTGTINLDQPAFTWIVSGGSAATGYVLNVTNADTSAVVLNNVSVSTSACKNGVCSYIPTISLLNGNYNFSVAGKNTFGVGVTNTPGTFTIFGFNSQFASNANGWIADYGTWKIGSGAYYSTTGGDAYYNANFTTFDYSARVKRINGEFFDYNYDSWVAPPTYIYIPGYTFYYYQWAHGFESMYYICQNSTDTCNSADTPALLVNDWNTLRVTVSGTTYNFYINGNLVDTFSDSNPGSSEVGVGFDKHSGTTTEFLVDWATLGGYDSGSAALPQTISTEQKALNAAGLDTSAGRVTFDGKMAILHLSK
jgi:C1A family cysteine protease